MPNAQDVEAGAVLGIQLERLENISFDIGRELYRLSDSNMAADERVIQSAATKTRAENLLFLPSATASALKAAK
jgi:hypothetical protein